MGANSFQIVGIVLQADLRRIAHRVRAAPIAHIEKNERAALCKPSEL